MAYDKPPLTFEQQVDQLIKRGLEITNPAKAANTLSHINYYRLSVYFLPFQSEKDCFDPGIRWEDVLCLYEFDRRLCLWMAEVLAEVEIGFRTQMAYYLAHQYGPFGYTDPANLSNDFRHGQWLSRVRENIRRSDETFVKHFRAKYACQNDLPVWMACEVVSFGQISQLYRGLRRHDRQSIARGVYGMDQRVLYSWIHSLVYVRNLCAHHSRIWNRILSIQPRKPGESRLWQNIRNDKIFCILLVCKGLIRRKARWEQLLENLLALLMDYRASAGVRAINELKPVIGLELTATPFVETKTNKGAVPFKNVILDYPLGRAMADGFVKEPAVVTRKDFNPKGMTTEEIEILKLEDGIRLHESVKVQLQTYALESGNLLVKPFLLVIARDTTHAGHLMQLIQSERFFKSLYKDKVIQVDSSKTGKEEDEMVERLLKVEHTDEPTEIVIHVNMLKEGWDVTNLYTIVPLSGRR